MNKTLYIIIAGIIVAAGLIGYTTFGKSSGESHTAGDGHTEAEHQESLPHDNTGKDHHNENGAVHHDDTGTTPHTD